VPQAAITVARAPWGNGSSRPVVFAQGLRALKLPSGGGQRVLGEALLGEVLDARRTERPRALATAGVGASHRVPRGTLETQLSLERVTII
jgi:hypothetical protein